MSFPDFSLIKFVAPGQHATPISGERTDLYKFFDAVVNKHSLEVDQFQLDEIFIKDLSIDTKKYDKILVSVLAEALIYFMTLWPGWEKSNDYYTGKIKCREWFEKFKNYLVVKTTFIINNSAKYMKKDKSKNRIGEVQADLLQWDGGKRVFPYVLCVGAPPDVLNNVVFVEAQGNVFIKQHSEKAWPDIQMKELINWPYVTVDIQLPDLSITRANTHMMPRFLALSSDATVVPEVEPIKHIKKLPYNEDKELQPYSYDFFASYFKQLKDTLALIPGVSEDRLTELEIIFSEFMSDIKEVNLHDTTMCPYLSVAFHIGKCKYIRNKLVGPGVGRKENEGINFYELVIPEVDFSLNYFNVEQDDMDNQNVSFVSLNMLKNNIDDNPNTEEMEALKMFVNEASVKYICTLCEEHFSGGHAYNLLYNHFQKLHKCEQTLLCHKCRQPYDVQYLAFRRWHHTCS